MSAAQVPRRWSMIHQIRGSGVLGRSRGRVATGREACEEGRWKCYGFSDPPGKGGCIHSAHESLSGAPGGRQMGGKRSFPIIKEQFLPLLESRSMNLSLRGRIRARLTVFGPDRAPDLSPCPAPHESSIVLGWRVLRRGPAGFAERLDSWRRSAHTDNPDPMTDSAPQILTVDDSKTVRRILAALFAPLGCTICESANGEEGLAVAALEGPDAPLSLR